MIAFVLFASLVSYVYGMPQNVQMFEIFPAEKIPVRLRFDPYEDTWQNFKQKHDKTYDKDEETRRQLIFMDNVKKIEQHNWQFFNMKQSYYLDINQFADLTFEEYKQYNKLMKRSANKTTTIHCTQFQPPLNWHVPVSVDWRTEGYVTPVKNQGQCGSCWSFSATGSLEGQNFRKTGKLVSLSEQQLVDCSNAFGNQGCNGGLMDQAFEYINSVGGIESESDYPYTAQDGTCHFIKSEVVADLSGCQDIEAGNEEALMDAVGSQGPVSVAIDASHTSFQFYKGGVYNEAECSSSELDHGVLVVGYGSLDGVEHWIVKNSWGSTWGVDGYIFMSRNKKNQCGIATSASIPVV